jgi:NAD(P)-dependent dehydrogenase (short-subunit alcohol dehydrogenase family)
MDGSPLQPKGFAMTITTSQMLTVFAAGALSVAFAIQAFAKEVSPERREAIIKCTKVATLEHPDDGGPATRRGRYQAYEACMAQMGQLP